MAKEVERGMSGPGMPLILAGLPGAANRVGRQQSALGKGEAVALSVAVETGAPAPSVWDADASIPPGDVKAGAPAGSIKLQQGKIHVVIGPNGAGKTRLMETIAGLRAPEGISIYFGDESLWHGSSPRNVRRNPAALLAYGYACQSPEEQLFARRAEEELHYVLKPYGLTEPERLKRMEDGLAAVGWDRSWLDKDPASMSGGERWRLALACLFAAPAAWLLLDEPTAGLDAAGHELLARQLTLCAASGQGVLLVSHDSDWSLALADRVLLIGKGGTVEPCVREDLLLQPELLRRAGLEQPEWFAAARELCRRGVPADRVWNPVVLAAEAMRLGVLPPFYADPEGRPEPETPETHEPTEPLVFPGEADGSIIAAQRLSAAVGLASPFRTMNMPEAATAQKSPDSPAGERLSTDPMNGRPGSGLSNGPQLLANDLIARTIDESPMPVVHRQAGSPLAGFDARAVWLGYVLLSTAVFMQHSWSGLALSGLLTAALIAAFRLPLRRWRGAIAALGSFTIIFSAIAGFGGTGGSWWSADDFLQSLSSLTPPFLTMLLGLGLPLAITPLRLRRSLEQTLSVRGKVPVPARTVILTVALLLRFVPILLAEWERFSRIAVARGKITRFTMRGSVNRLRDIAIPFMLALFRLGDQVADALISRGAGFRKHPTILRTEKWRRRDSLLLAGSGLLAILLWWMEFGAAN